MMVTWKGFNPSYIIMVAFAFHSILKTKIKNSFGNALMGTSGGHLPPVFFIQKVGARYVLGIILYPLSKWVKSPKAEVDYVSQRHI